MHELMIESQTAGSIYATATMVGVLHGVEPGHGWPVAALYALARRRRWLYGGVAGSIIATAHLISSFAVVALFALLDRLFGITEMQYATRIAGLVLLAMAVYQWRHARVAAHGGHKGHSHAHAGVEDEPQHAHTGEQAARRGLWGIVAFAFALGFAHEEEFAVVALCAGRASCWGVMGVYAVAVAASILALTLASVATFNRFETRLARWERYLPNVSALVLALMGFAYLLGVL
jgi:ABC-type nickel/cobalt efflux system permease component RcnA